MYTLRFPQALNGQITRLIPFGMLNMTGLTTFTKYAENPPQSDFSLFKNSE